MELVLRTKVPSAFLLTDILLHLDRLLGFKLIVPGEGDTKVVAAARDAKRLKKLMGALRSLYRNSTLSFSEACMNAACAPRYRVL